MLLISTLAFVQLHSASPAQAVTVAGFEIDGNLISEGATDWASLSGQPVSLDRVDSDLDDGFKSGNSAKELNPDGWATVIGKVTPSANDIGDIYVSGRLEANRQYAFFGFERATTGGSTAYNLELNTRPNKINANGLSVPDRVVGDLLLDVVQQGGGALSLGGVYRWDGSNWALFTPGAGSVVAENNTVPVTDVDGNTLPAGTFAEIGVNLTTLFSSTSACPGVDFVSMNLRSRSSSSSVTSDLKDYVRPAPISIPTGCGQLRIEKKDAVGTLLPGAAFQITPNPVPGGTGASLTVTDGGTNDPDGAANGVIALPKALITTYTVAETSPPLGYIPAGGSQSVPVTSGNVSTVTFTNGLGSASWRKVDATTGAQVAGATFSLTATGGAALALQPAPRTIVDNGANDVDPAAGAIKVTGLYTGSYSLAETVAPPGYDLPSAGNPKTFSVTTGAPDAVLAAAYQDPRKPGRIVVNKTDAQSGASIDATFQLWRDNGDGVFSSTADTAVGSATPTSGGTLTFGNLTWGSYWVEEVSAPQGYSVSPGSPFAVTLAANNLTATVNVADPQIRSTLVVSKTDAVTGAALANGQFRLFRDSDGTAGPSAGDDSVGTCSTDALGSCLVGNLAFGTYYWQETSPPPGYALPLIVYSASVTVNATNAGTTLPVSRFADVRAITSVSLTKTAGAIADVDGNGPDAGDTVAYRYAIANTGNTPVYAPFAVSDDKVSVVCPTTPTSLAPGAEPVVCSATYTLTLADVDRGSITNRATATAASTSAGVGTVTSNADTVIVEIAQAAALTVDKQAGAPSGNTVGSTIDYTFVVTNTGNVTLDPVSVDDPKVTAVVCPVTTLAPTEFTTCTATYTLTSADVIAGVVNNTATAYGNPPGGDPDDTADDASTTDTTTTTIPAEPKIALDKAAGTPSGTVAGSTIDYTFVVTNTGNVTLDPVTVDDPKLGTVTCLAASLAPTVTTLCYASYTLTQLDVDSGVVNNTATAYGNPPGGDPDDTADDASAGDSTSTPVAPDPALTLEKVAGTPTGSSAGSTIGYTFVVSNTGNVTLDPVTVDDPKVGTVLCPVTTLAPGASTTCTAAYTLTQADVDSGVVVNTATGYGNPPGGDPDDTADDASSSDSATTTIPADPSIALDKTAGAPSGNKVGDTIGYTFVVSNTGNVTLDSVSVDDPKVGTVACPDPTLAPGASTTCTATYTLTQLDVDAGVVDNSATAYGNLPGGDPDDPADDASASDSTSTPVTAGPAIALVKTAGAPSGNKVGDTTPYTFVVSNTGNVTLDSVSVDDPKVGTVTCFVTTLAPGTSTTCTATYTLTQADVDAGEVVNTATAYGNPPGGDPDDPADDASSSDSTSTPIEAEPAVTLSKVAGTPTGSSAGSTIAYTFVVTNTGNVTLDPVTVDDPKVTAVVCPVTTLAPGASTTCTTTYTLTQADVDAGVVDNSATAYGNPPGGDPDDTDDDVSATDSTTTTVTQTPSLALLKTASTPTGNASGDTIDYTFLVTNTGNVTLDPVAVDDPKVGTVTCPDTTLAPDASTTCRATYTLTQADVDAGQVVNIATAYGNLPGGDPVDTDDDVSATDSTTTTVTQTPSIALVKTADTPTGSDVGDTIDYAFLVTNTGNVTLDPVAVDDPKVGTVTCPVTTLAPDASTTCTATYALTQPDVDAGVVVNIATAYGNLPGGDPVDTDDDVSATDSTTTTITQKPTIALDKSAGTPSGNTEGDTIDYTFLVTNTGNVTLDPVAVDDPKVGTVACPATTLAPGASTTCTATYTLTQADVDSGVVDNTATAYGNPPSGDPDDTDDDASATDSISTPIVQTPSISLDKQSGEPSGNTAGSTIDYTFLVTNTGNVTLDTVTVDDPKVGTVLCPVTTLAPGASTTCTATYILTQTDVDAGNVPNTAIVVGNPPTGPPVEATDSTDTPIVPGPAITLLKQAGTPTGDRAGDTIDYTFLVTNTGNVTLSNIAVDDAKVGMVTCPVTSLAPNESTTCTATYTLTQADVDAGSVLNTATATGTDPNQADVSATDSVTVDIPAAPAIALDKQAIEPAGGSAGDTVDYTFTVTNTGNVTLTNMVVTDPMVDAVTCPVTTLAPTESTTCSATYTLTQADVDAGEVVNTATVAGLDPNQTGVTATDTVTTPITQTPGISLDKIVTAQTPVTVGDTIDYTFVVTNTGNITLVDIEVSDPMLGTVTCPATTLAPGEAMTCTAPPYTVTAQDVKNGQVDNQAAVEANAGNVLVNDADEVSIETGVPPKPKLELDKSSDASGPVRMGEVITYTFTATNTGNVALTDVRVDDPMLGTVTCDTTTLKPGQSTTCTAPGYVVTQADVRAGVVRNTATAQGSYCPDGGTCSKATDADSLNVQVFRPPSLPDTGSPVSPSMLALAGSLLVAGMMLLAAGRRRATDDA